MMNTSCRHVRFHVPLITTWALAASFVGCGSDSGGPAAGNTTGSTISAGIGATSPASMSSGGVGGAGSSAASGGSGATRASANNTGTAGKPSTSTSATATGTAGASSQPSAAGVGGGAGTIAAAGSGGASGAAGVAEGVAGSAGSAGAGGAPATETHEDLGKGDGSDVVELGDSYMSNTLQIEGTGGGIVPSLAQASGQRYRNYAVQGTMLLMDDSFGPAIPTQWDDAVRQNPKIRTVIMTGGGNDIIQSDALKASCMMGGDDCKKLLMDESAAFNTLWTKMAEAGVKDIIHVGYATDTGTVDPSILGSATTPEICMSGKIRCHDLDTTALIMKQLAGDGIHPLQGANDRVAKAIVDLMEKEGIRR
jgi:hypothetical protein